MLWIDLETRSQTNLAKHGLARYAQCPTTAVICMSYAFDDLPVETWFADSGQPFPKGVILACEGNTKIYAQNAQFERYMFEYVISNDYDFAPPDLTQWRCSSARAMAHGLPPGLKDICIALAMPIRKMSEGTRLIRDYCSPRFLTEWKPGDRELMRGYCETDVETMRMFCRALRELTDEEWREYHIVEDINDTGVPVDVAFAVAAVEYAAEVKESTSAAIKELTGDEVPTARSRKHRDLWLLPKLTSAQLKLLTRNGKISFDQKAREKLLARDDLDPVVREFILLVDSAGGSTVSKFKNMVEHNVNGRVHGTMVWNGAGQTGRLSSRSLQVNNMKRDVMDNAQELIQDVIDGYEIPEPAVTLSRLVRAAITSQTGVSYSDFAQIEARVLPWLLGEDNDNLLELFREDRDLYVENAMSMFDIPIARDVDKETRQAAKCASLACQFGGGKGAILAMAEIFGQTYTEDQASDIANRWRNANPEIVHFWHEVKKAAHSAVRVPGVPYPVGELVYVYDGREWLWCKLPCGRFIAYCQPRFEEIEYPWGEVGVELTCLWGGGRPKVGEPWPRRPLSHLILVENATQAVAASLMRGAIVRAYDADLEVIFSCHDELVCVGDCVAELHDVMEYQPVWARRLPIAAETQHRMRYGK